MISSVPLGELSVGGFDQLLPPAAASALHRAEWLGRSELAGRRIWNVNSTARGGGVAEMLVTLLAYARGSGIDARWLVIGGEAEFFALTKRIHNRLHGVPGDGGALGTAERDIYQRALAASGEELRELVAPGDVIILHDPQTAGLIPWLRDTGTKTIWRCHVGLDVPNTLAREAWWFLEPYVMQADAYVFSREAFVWDELAPEKRAIIAPSIDVFSPKNAELDGGSVAAILATAGLRLGGAGEGCFRRLRGGRGVVRRRAQMLEERSLGARERYVLQVSRWDSLKDPLGVIEGFAAHVAPPTDAHLVSPAPDVLAVADDPEGAAVFALARNRWYELPEA